MSAASETFRLLQPGLMSFDELKVLISQSGIILKSNDNKSKHQLVELYERLLLPLSQRKFPKTHQGQIINKKIIEEERKQAKMEPKSRNNLQYGFNDKSSSSSSKCQVSQQSCSSSSSSSSRLKPPIDSASLPSKKICLSRRPSSDKELDKIVINDHSKRHSESSSDGSGRESSHNVEKRDTDKKSPVKSHSSTHKETKERDKEEPNPKRRRIAWP